VAGEGGSAVEQIESRVGDGLTNPSPTLLRFSPGPSHPSDNGELGETLIRNRLTSTRFLTVALGLISNPGWMIAGRRFLSAGLLAGSILLVSETGAQSSQVPAAPETRESAAVPAREPSPSATSKGTGPSSRAAVLPSVRRLYQANWGVDNLQVKAVSSGLMLRFSYRVVDANKAQVLNDKKATPLLIDVKSGSQFVVPTMEKTGQLRQTASPENGREYWMIFSNKSNFVKPGNKVDIVIGAFRADGLTVQ